MDGALDNPIDRLRRHPFAVDVALAAAVWFCTVLLPAAAYWQDPASAFLIGTLLTVPLAWRRRAPVPAAAAWWPWACSSWSSCPSSWPPTSPR